MKNDTEPMNMQPMFITLPARLASSKASLLRKAKRSPEAGTALAALADLQSLIREILVENQARANVGCRDLSSESKELLRSIATA